MVLGLVYSLNVPNRLLRLLYHQSKQRDNQNVEFYFQVYSVFSMLDNFIKTNML